MSNAIASNACFPIATKLAVTYEVSNAAVNSVAMIFLLVYTLMNFPANYLVDLKGLRIGVCIRLMQLIFGSGLISLGLGLTLFINGSFWWLLVGTFVVAAGQPFVINCPAKIATFWFHKENVQLMILSEALCNIASHRHQPRWYRRRLCSPNRHCRGRCNWPSSQVAGVRAISRGIHFRSNCFCDGPSVHAQATADAREQRQ